MIDNQVMPQATPVKYLQQDPVLGQVVTETKISTPQPSSTLFKDLAESIINQQLSNKAAASIFGRFLDLFPDHQPEAHTLLSLPEETLRLAGISRPKVTYLRSLAEEVASGKLVLSDLQKLSDEDVITALTRIKGIGRWTAEMFLIFNMIRPDILPLDDVGLIKAISLNYFSGEPVSRHEAREVAANWAPWRTVATWYMWRSIDPIPVEY